MPSPRRGSERALVRSWTIRVPGGCIGKRYQSGLRLAMAAFAKNARPASLWRADAPNVWPFLAAFASYIGV
jgi:hypothetical protein